jgi:hypothetical protein
MQDNGDEKKLGLDLDKKLQPPEGAVTSKNLLKSVSLQLYSLMTKVVSHDVNPKTVAAACQCASQIHNMLKLNNSLLKSHDE